MLRPPHNRGTLRAKSAVLSHPARARHLPDPVGVTRPHLSVVVPVFNEEENVPLLAAAVRDALGDGSWELLLVDDGSTDRSAAAAAAAAAADPRVRLVELARNYGQTLA